MMSDDIDIATIVANDAIMRTTMGRGAASHLQAA